MWCRNLVIYCNIFFFTNLVSDFDLFVSPLLLLSCFPCLLGYRLFLFGRLFGMFLLSFMLCLFFVCWSLVVVVVFVAVVGVRVLFLILGKFFVFFFVEREKKIETEL